MCLLLSASLWSVASVSAESASAPATTPAPAVVDELEQLVAPIALYPDVLIALILPAATESSDVVLAARFLEGGGQEAQIDAQPWQDSVKGLARYPEVVKWMDENLAWTRQLGDAYLDNPENVMAAIQRTRQHARANGLLVDGTQQQVVVDGDYIRIVPAQPNVIYVPRYDPDIIYVERRVYRPDPWITFGVGFGVGAWLGYDCDWGRRVIVVNPHYRHHWRSHHDWRHHRFVHRPDHHVWKPWASPHRRPHHHRRDFNRPGRVIVRPTPLHPTPRHWDGRDRDRDRDQRRRFGDNDRRQRPPHIGGSEAPRAHSPAPNFQRGGATKPADRVTTAPEWRRRDGEPRGPRTGERRARRDGDGPRHFTPQQRQPGQVGAAPVPRVQQTPRVHQAPRMHQRGDRVAAPAQAPRQISPPARTPPQVAAAASPSPSVQRGPAMGGGDRGGHSAPRVAPSPSVSRGDGGGHGDRPRADRRADRQER